MAIVVWEWEEKDARTGRWKRLGWMMTEGDAEAYSSKHQVELRRVEGSREERGNTAGDRPGGYGSGLAGKREG